MKIGFHVGQVVAPTREAARRLARPRVEAKYAGYAAHGLPGVGAALSAGVEALMPDPFIVGSPDEGSTRSHATPSWASRTSACACSGGSWSNARCWR